MQADARQKVAREAAALLYFGLEKEYKQAKQKAADNIGARILPSNREVALELDKLAEETEGSARVDRLVLMRKEALRVMKILKAYCPVLIGSVWRGTIRRGSDIDIAVYHDIAEEVLTQLKEKGIQITKTNRTNFNKQGKTQSSFHIYAHVAGGNCLEIVVRNLEEAGKKRKCETFGDELKGLKINELERVLEENPTQKFIPS
jgi:predicted nucleotidyltransferase